MPSRSAIPPRVAAGLLTGALAACAGSGARKPLAEPAPASSTVTSDDIQRSPGEKIEEILRGRIAGVVVERTADGGMAVRVRGATSFQGSEAPLYLVDGVAVEPGPNGSLAGLNPYDIESIKVLKDPASLTMYGSRGANGVVVIRTKRAARQ